MERRKEEDGKKERRRMEISKGEGWKKERTGRDHSFHCTSYKPVINKAFRLQ